MPRARAMTLIELLIVVAVVGLLATIAVLNFREAMTRSKVARVKADFQAIVTALASYRLDNEAFPPNDTARFSIIPLELTTPVAYLTHAELHDPFSVNKQDEVYGELTNYYSYFKIVDYEQAVTDLHNGKPAPFEAIDDTFFNPGALNRYGLWRLVSKGPDGDYTVEGMTDITKGSDIVYDPTNGTDSVGNILWSQAGEFLNSKQ